MFLQYFVNEIPPIHLKHGHELRFAFMKGQTSMLIYVHRHVHKTTYLLSEHTEKVHVILYTQLHLKKLLQYSSL